MSAEHTGHDARVGAVLASASWVMLAGVVSLAGVMARARGAGALGEGVVAAGGVGAAYACAAGAGVWAKRAGVAWGTAVGVIAAIAWLASGLARSGQAGADVTVRGVAWALVGLHAAHAVAGAVVHVRAREASATWYGAGLATWALACAVVWGR